MVENYKFIIKLIIELQQRIKVDFAKNRFCIHYFNLKSNPKLFKPTFIHRL